MKVKRDHRSKFSNLSNWKDDEALIIFFRLLLSNCLNWKIDDHASLSSTTDRYELFRVCFTWFHCTGRYELNKLTLLPMCGFVAQLVEHRAGISRRSWVRIPLRPWFFFRLLLSNCLNWKIYCDDHASLSSTTAVQIWIISCVFHKLILVAMYIYYGLKSSGLSCN